MPGPMGRHGRSKRAEKPKDLFGTWKKLFGYLRKSRSALICALICAILGVLCTLAGPGKLSDLTDAVTKGIIPNQAVLEEISSSMKDNLEHSSEEFSRQLQENMQKAQALAAMQAAPGASLPGAAANLEDLAPSPIELNGQTISLEDQQKAAELFANMEQDKPDENSASSLQNAQSDSSDSADSSKSEESLSAALGDMDQAAGKIRQLKEMPASVQKALLPDLHIDGQTITTKDQIDMIETLSSISPNDQQAALDAIDRLPSSIYSLTKPSIDMKEVTSIALSFVFLIALGWLLSLIQGWIMATLTQKTSFQMREDISKKINRLPISYFEKTTIGDILSRITNDIDTISQSLNQSISTLLTNSVMLIGSLYLMLTTNVTMTATAILASLFGFVLMFFIMGRSQKYFSQMQNSLGRLNGHIEEVYTGHTVVKAYNDEQHALQLFKDYNEAMVSSAFKATSLASIMQPMMAFIGNFGYVAICVVGGAMALNGSITFGTIVAFIMYVRYFTQPLSQIAQAFSSMQSAAAAGERVFAFLEEPEMSDESNKTAMLPAIRGEVDFSHVRFRYPGADHDVIHDFSAKAHPGQKIAIVGPTGAGKTTLVNLLMRFYETDGGTISIDGMKTTDLRRSEVHKQFCMVLQDTWLFEGTLRENLAYSTPDLSDAEILKACEAVGLDHLVHTLPKGLDTILNDQVSLSVGQKQQVTIARAMLANHPMLILDEATSSVDTRTEQQIQRAMDTLMQKRTSFVIAHRLSTIKDADLILVMNHGDIIETGTHEELLAKNGFYAGLYNAQFDDSDSPDPIASKPA